MKSTGFEPIMYSYRVLLLPSLLLLNVTWFSAGEVLTTEHEELREEVCMLDHFSPGCPEGSVLRMKTALYGRMAAGKCVTSAEYVGCSVNVIEHLERKCSGRRSCVVEVGTPKKDWPLACDTERFAYLEATYHCLQVYDTSKHELECRTSQPLKISVESGYLASITVEQTGRGSFLCPWQISTQSGRTILLTLIDFGNNNRSASSALARSTGSMCDVYAKVVELSLPISMMMICGEGFRESVVYASSTSTVQLTILQKPGVHFLIKFEAVGCPDFVDPHSGKVERSGDQMVVQCSSSDTTWQASCVKGTWMPDNPCLLNAAVIQPTSSVASAQSPGALILLVIGLAVLTSITIIVMGILFLRCKSRRTRYSVEGDAVADTAIERSLYSTAMCYDGLRGPYPLLSGRQRTPSDWERYYATTLQMRQNIPSPSNYHPILGSTDGVWTCPRHGQLASPIRTCDRRLRPRLDNLQVIAKQNEEVGVAIENGNRSPFYHQLDPNALTLGPTDTRRNPTTVSSTTVTVAAPMVTAGCTFSEPGSNNMEASFEAS